MGMVAWPNLHGTQQQLKAHNQHPRSWLLWSMMLCGIARPCQVKTTFLCSFDVKQTLTACAAAAAAAASPLQSEGWGTMWLGHTPPQGHGCTLAAIHQHKGMAVHQLPL
jgi:hypothetical protein